MRGGFVFSKMTLNFFLAAHRSAKNSKIEFGSPSIGVHL
jgi:hypothetical protein